MSTRTSVESVAATTIRDLDLEPRGRVFPSPLFWKDHVFYQIIPDRFSDGREAERPLFDATRPDQYRAADKRAWMQAGLGFNGGTLRGIRSKLDYLEGLGITGLWLNPVCKQRADLQTYHGYAIQNFLDVDPRFGTLQDLRDLIDDAHDRGMLVVLDVVIDHTGNNWFYGPDVTGLVEESLPYRYEPPYSFGGWRSGMGERIDQIRSLKDGCWPIELQRLEAYNRCGSTINWTVYDTLDPNAEYRRGDFFDLKKLNGYDHETMQAIIRCHQYWIAVTDCDGFRIDAAKHIPKDLCHQFSWAIFQYAVSIGKNNFMLAGEITDLVTSVEYLSLLGSVSDRVLSTVLDINQSPDQLAGAVRGTAPPMDYFDRFRSDADLYRDVYRDVYFYVQTGFSHITVLDDHDMASRSRKERFAAHNETPHRAWQSAHAVGVLLTVPGIPCIYYGTEQALMGNEEYHDYTIEPQRFGEDRYVRECMFGGAFGAEGTTGCHFFNPEHPTYLRIAAIGRIRKADDYVGRTLRFGFCYPRETRIFDHPYAMPGAGELFGWSRILADHEVLIALNTNGIEPRGAEVTIDAGFHRPGSQLRVLYRADWSDAQLRNPPTDERVEVQHTTDGRAFVRLDLPAASMVILG